MSSQPATQGAVNRGNLPKGACYKCGKTGHWSRDCTAPREEWVPQQPRDAPGTTADAGDVDPEASTQNKPKKKSTRAPKFTVVDHLLGPNGLAYLHDVIPEKFNEIAKGPGHEFGDFQRLMGLYKEWTRKMYPYKPHEWVMNRVKVLSKTKEVRACVRELNERERIELGGDGVDVPEDFNPEDVVFPDADPDDDDDEGEDVVFPDDDDDDEEEWNEAKHGEKARKKLAGADEDDELAELMRESNAERKGKTKGKKAVEPKGADSDDEEPVQSQMEDMGDAFDEARKTVGEGYFDESSDDDDEGGIALVNTTRRKSSALGAGEKGKARKKLKEVAAKRRRKKKEPTPEPEPEPEPEAAEEEPEPEPARKKLRRRARDSDDDDSDDEDDEEEEAGANRRARRRVVKRGIESDSDDDLPIPQHLGGTMLAPSPAKPLIPSFLYESDDEKKTETKE